MILGINDETAVEIVTQAMTEYPMMNNDEVYEYIRCFRQIPVSRRQVAITTKAIKASLKKQKG